MPEMLVQAWAMPGLIWLILTISVAGVVRGFTGFGTALIFVPVAGIFLQPATIIGVITLTGIASTAALVPRAWRLGNKREVGQLAGAAILTVPIGLALLQMLDAGVVRWSVAVVAAVTLATLVAGWRYTGRVTWPGLLAIGAMGGLIGGLTGLTGPVVILFYLAGQAAVQSVRANTILFLACLDFVIVGNLLWLGSLDWQTAVLAGVLAVPYFITSLIGQALFDPRHERLYRWMAYGIIGLALITGLPIWTMGD